MFNTNNPDNNVPNNNINVPIINPIQMFRYNSEYVAIITSITHCVNSNNIAFQYNNDDCYSKNSLKTQILNERSKVPQIANSLAKLTVNNFTELKRPLVSLRSYT